MGKSRDGISRKIQTCYLCFTTETNDLTPVAVSWLRSTLSCPVEASQWATETCDTERGLEYLYFVSAKTTEPFGNSETRSWSIRQRCRFGSPSILRADKMQASFPHLDGVGPPRPSLQCTRRVDALRHFHFRSRIQASECPKRKSCSLLSECHSGKEACEMLAALACLSWPHLPV